MISDANGVIEDSEIDDSYTFLNNTLLTQCLKYEVEFLKNSNMSMLIDPEELYVNDDGSSWNDSMAYLCDNKDNISLLKKRQLCSKKDKPLLKCGFIITGRPKKVWAINLPNASIEIDDCNNKWFQVGKDMILTTYNVLYKYRCQVQSAQQYGIRHFSDTYKNKEINTVVVSTKDAKNAEAVNTQGIISTITKITQDGELCCSGDRCGMIHSDTRFIMRKNIRHKCCVCKGAMHRGICGAKASTILINSSYGQNNVICYLCISKESLKSCKLL